MVRLSLEGEWVGLAAGYDGRGTKVKTTVDGKDGAGAECCVLVKGRRRGIPGGIGFDPNRATPITGGRAEPCRSGETWPVCIHHP